MRLLRFHCLFTVVLVVVAGFMCAMPDAGGEEPEPPAGLESDAEQGDEGGPSLPSGLDDDEEEDEKDGEPGLPPGLDGEDEDEGGAEPGLPAGLEDDAQREKPPAEESDGPSLRERLPVDVSGFWEARYGTRLQSDPHQPDTILGESRLQLDLQRYVGNVRLKLVSDFLYDPIAGRESIDLEQGRGWLDLRQANIAFSPVSFADVRMGRQILTWGTGNLLFLNDMFPKDWNSFFIGRDLEYLKAPSDAVKVSLYGDPVNVDLVYVPAFDGDRFVDGRRLSYWNPQLQRRAGRGAIVRPESRQSWGRDDEWAVRMYRNIHGYELAAYGYHGYWKSPSGYDPVARQATFPRLSTFGASIRGNVLGGIGNLEVAYYDSREDRGGDDPFVPNSQLRMLAGYEWEMARNLTVGLQYYLELMRDYDNYRDSLPPGARHRDEDRHVVTLDITRLMMNQNLELSLFTFYSPSDNDMYLRPSAEYQIDDHWSVEAGGNILAGEHRHTFFNQFRNNTSVYAAVRYGF
ncbi:MAG: hypothetical protein ACOCQ9_00325 [Candidatus Brocadiia bacterium]